MHITQLRLRNWLPFRGEHVLDLGPGAHAVVAKRGDDPERSNGSGKTALLEAVLFVLEGEHRKRTEDEWITAGEHSGEGELSLSNGARILRSRARGKRTTLYYFPPGGGEPAMQDEAQRLVDQLVGLSADDFRATCYLGQRQTARLVLARPEERMAIVSAWLQLGPLERCEDRARERASALSQRLATVEQQRAQYREALGGTDDDALLDAMNLADNDAARKRDAVTALQDAVARNADLIAQKRAKEEYDEIVKEGVKLKADLDARGVEDLRRRREPVETRHTEASVAFDNAARDKKQKLALARGKFDGHCPVAEIECPVASDINKRRAANQKLAEEAEERARKAERAMHDAAEEADKLAADLQAADRIQVRVDSLRQQAAKLKEKKGGKSPQPKDPQALRDQLTEAQDALQAALQRVSSAREALRLSKDVRARLEALEAEAAQLQADLATAREAVVVFGKQGAQRRVAESAMSEIEDGTNAVLEACGVDLSVRVAWSREGSGLARACDACGHPFPTSAKAKSCERCHAARGPQLIHRCEFELSDRSGGLEDFAGVGLQLSAAAWLRRERGIAWSTALIDEPFGALDQANRRALGAHLAAMLAGEYGFAQSFIVAHSPDVLAALPHRIEVTRHDGRSEVRVVT